MAAVDDVGDGGASVYILYPENQSESKYIQAGKFCSNFSVEVQAIEEVANMVYNSDSNCHQAIIFTDTLAVLVALKSGKLANLRSVLNKISVRQRI